MTERTPKTPRPVIAEELGRRISDAMSSEKGLGGDADLGKILASDKGASRYAKDLSRLDMWLASWPVPEPSDAAMEALATRIEQRLGETLPGAASTFLGPPTFDDEDALRDAAANLLRPGVDAEPAKFPSRKATLVGSPTALGLAPRPGATAAGPAKTLPHAAVVPKPGAASPVRPAAATKLEIAKPAEAKAEPAKADTAKADTAKTDTAKADTAKADTAKTDTAKADTAKADTAKTDTAKADTAKADTAKTDTAKADTAKAEPSVEAAELDRISLVPVSDESISLVPELAAPTAAHAPAHPPAAPPKPPKAKKRKSDAPPAITGRAKGSKTEDRISIPVPAPTPFGSVAPLAAPIPLDARRSVPPKGENKRNWWPLLAAAAVVALGVAVGSQFMLGAADRNASATATVASFREPEAPALAPASPPPAAAAPMEAPPTDIAAFAAAEESESALAGGLAADGMAGLGGTAAPITTLPAPTAPSVRAALDDELLAREDGPVRRRAPGPTTGTSTRGGELAGARSEAAAEGRTAAAGAPSGGARSSGGAVGGSGTTSRSGSGSAAGGSGVGSGAGGSGSGGGTVAGGASAGGSTGSATGGRARSTGPLEEVPSRTEVRDVLDGVAPQVYACFGEEHGLAEVVVVAASSGRVTTATVSGRFAGTPVGSCIARAVRSARFPEFTNPRFEVHYEYRH